MTFPLGSVGSAGSWFTCQRYAQTSLRSALPRPHREISGIPPYLPLPRTSNEPRGRVTGGYQRVWLLPRPLSFSSTPDAAFGGLATVPPQREFAHGLREISAGSVYLRGSSGIQQALGLRLGDIVHCRFLCFRHTSTEPVADADDR
jgi:hypothetical protein